MFSISRLVLALGLGFVAMTFNLADADAACGCWKDFKKCAKGKAKDGLIVEIEGLNDRDAAQALKGTRLYVERAALPAPEDPEEFYHADLIGLAVETAEGAFIGRVESIEDFGAGPILEIKRASGTALLLPFTRQAVPQVDLAAGRLIADPPKEVEAKSAD